MWGRREGCGRFGLPSLHELWLALLLQADELDGEIDLRSCTDVSECMVQRNYGFQIHVRLGLWWGTGDGRQRGT